MTEGTEIMAAPSSGPLSPADVLAQVGLIQHVMSEVMHDGEHYGKIPGTGDKPSLLQPGAQILALTFRLGPKFRVQQKELDGGHREFYVECELFSMATGQLIGMGVGMTSTMESKWRFRTGPVEFTGRQVPTDYWDARKDDPGKARELLGGRGFQTRKNPDTGYWEIVRAGEKVENENPADVYNTALKIASKRAFVHAVLNTTAASDMFTQDVEDLTRAETRAAPKVDEVTLGALRKLRDKLGVDHDLYAQQLATKGVTVDSSLPQVAALELVAAYERRAGQLPQPVDDGAFEVRE